jgi:2-oxoglutarate dehydrogenase E2 component (dihydrolipoamide succinyltransferase)
VAAPTAERPATVVRPVAQPIAPEPVAAPPVAAAPIEAQAAAAQPAAAEPIAAQPVAAEPVVAKPATAEPVDAATAVAQPIASRADAAGSTRNEAAAASPPAAAPRAPATPPPQPIRARTEEVLQFSGEAEFLALPSAQFTIQIARASRAGLLHAEFLRLRTPGVDGLADRTPYIVSLGRGASAQSLLLWGSFADAASARAAWDALPAPDGGKPAAYPRRIAPLQDEVRRTLSTR